MIPLISIIIPNYNHALYLPNRLLSIFSQTYSNLEVIILDDNSKDNSLSILKKYINHPIVSHFILNQENTKSPFKQWKKGISLAKGKYIWIAESDDWASKQFLERLIPILESDESIALAYCQSNKVNEKGKVVENMINYTGGFRPNKWRYIYVNSGEEEIKNYLIYKNTIPNASAVVFRNEKNIIQHLKEDMKMVGDWWFWINIIKEKKIAFIPESLNFFRSHNNSTRENLNLENKFKNILERMDVLDLIQSFYPNENLHIKKIKEDLILELILWIYPNQYKEANQFINTTFNNKFFFSTLLFKAYLLGVKLKINGIKRRFVLVLLNIFKIKSR